MNAIETEWGNFNDTQRAILFYLFMNGSATISELVGHTHINGNSIRNYLNTFISQGIVERHSQKQRDANANYTLKKD